MASGPCAALLGKGWPGCHHLNWCAPTSYDADVARLRYAHAEQAAELARTRYERGFIGYFEVLAAEQELTTTRDARVRSQTGVVLAMVDVYRALAGAPTSREDQ